MPKLPRIPWPGPRWIASIEPSWLRATVGVSEGWIALLGILLLVGIPSLFVAPFTQRTDVPLVSLVEESSGDALMESVRAEQIAREAVLLEAPDGSRLRLYGVYSESFAEVAIPEILAQHGYAAASPAIESFGLDLPELARSGRLHWLLGIQAFVFFTVGGLMARTLAGPLVRRGARLLRGIAGGVGFGLLAFGVSVGLAALLSLLGFPVQEQDEIKGMLSSAGMLSLIPWIVLILPAAEEVFFRGYVLRRVTLAAGAPAGYLVASFLFAIVHFNPSGFVIYGAVGFVFALAYTRSGHFAAPVVAHVVYNGAVMLTTALVGGL